MKTEPKTRSGAKWTERQYAERGYGRLALRLPTNVLDLLAQKAEAAGLSRAEFITAAILKFEAER